MDCAKFEDLLFARLEVDLGDADEAALREHAKQCLSCRRLWALLEQGDVPVEAGDASVEPGDAALEPGAASVEVGDAPAEAGDVLAGDALAEAGNAPADEFPPVPEELLPEVVEQTSGTACDRVASILPERLYAPLDAPFDAPFDSGGSALRLSRKTPARNPADCSELLLAAHLDRCTDCAALARALTRLKIELPRLAAIDPGEAFTTAVLAATSNRRREVSLPTVGPAAGDPDRRAPTRVPSHVRTVRRALDSSATWSSQAVRARGRGLVDESGLGARLEAAWARLVRRPRFALEGAYAAALLIVLVAGVPSTSAAELPVRVFDELRRETARVEETVSSGVGAAVARGREAVSGAAERAARILAPELSSEMTAENPFASRDAAVASAARAWAAAREMASAIWNGILGPFAEHVGSLWLDEPSHEAPEEIAHEAEP